MSLKSKTVVFAKIVTKNPCLPSTALRKSPAFATLAKKQDLGKEYTLVQSSDKAENGVPQLNNFVNAAFQAYSNHQGLVLRPDDVWQAIVTQMSFYVQARAEALRSKFVAHEGQCQLTVRVSGTLFTADHADVCQLLLNEIRKNIKDASVVDWLEPGFSTTTTADSVASAISVMATLQAYFGYKVKMMCGLPEVELLGTVEDWRRLLAKIARLAEFDAGDGHLVEWAAMLTPVVAEMVATKEGKDNMDWWQRIAHYKNGGSGPSYLSGWITVFCCFTHQGAWQGDKKEVKLWYESTPRTSEWPFIETDDIPTAVVAVPVVIDDNGTAEHNGILTAGQVCSNTPGNEYYCPRTDWALHVPASQLQPPPT